MKLSRPRPLLTLLAFACAAPISLAGAQRPTTPPPARATPPVPPTPPVIAGDIDEAMVRAHEAVEAAAAAIPEPAELAQTVRGALDRARAVQSEDIEQLASAREAMEASRQALVWARPMLENLNVDFGFSSGSARPAAPWAQGDPADSVYREARNTINRGDYRRAAALFASIPQRYPRSAYAAAAPYWQAFALYRLGGTDDLRTAASALQQLMANQGELSRRQRDNMDVSGLYARINGVLASRGDRDAAARLTREAQQAGHPTCDKEDLSVRVEALNALARTDPGTALPLLGRVLHSTGECSTELRRNAVFILGQRGDSSAAAVLADVARTDPDVRVREAAIEWLPRLPNAPIATIESLLRDTSATVQRAAVRALMSSDDPRARQSIRGLIDRADVSDNLRIAAINSFTSEHATGDDAAYLRGAFAKTDNARVKNAIVYAISRIGGTDNEQWLLALAKNSTEPSSVRATAIERLGRTSMSITDLAAMYDNADSRAMRFQIINILADRKESGATDKLLDIARAGTDPTVRTRAIDALTRKKDPRTTKLLLDIIDRSAAADEKKP
jgi:HEAT repeat protein